MTTTSLNRQARRAQKRQELQAECARIIIALSAYQLSHEGTTIAYLAEEHRALLESLAPTTDFTSCANYIAQAQQFMRNFHIPYITD